MLHGFYIVGAFPSLCELNVQLFCCHKLCLDYRVFVFLKYFGDFGAINSDKTSAGAINVSYCLCGLFVGIIFIVEINFLFLCLTL